MQNLRLVVVFLVVSCVLTPIKMVSAAEIGVVANQLSKIDLNTANAEALKHSFKGIGARRAEAIIQYRDAHGPFKSVRELAEVKGLGRSFVDRNEADLEKTFEVK